ncbi:endonuclease domain-containing protein [Sphingorhabdus soli]|uniref:Endonuclease domain-containing protein n=1 Tax=Flavisphingopyxis soli TaxID=2601267 RepID=A0A5C6UN73_9SPHN|nr:endonuclease domain-containing protein [Sphingorhabdus soli]TXC73516.1 endonuclease domain-containing protein [Sphingorhabdus soli]
MINGPGETVRKARTLRKALTLPEGLLWRELRQRPGELKFRRQHPAGVYILDFFCAQARLAIEVDGIAHDGLNATERDEARARYLSSQGVTVLRIPASDVLDDIESVVRHIVDHAGRALPLHQPEAGPPPRSGEE